MLSVFDSLRDVNMVSITVRMVLAVLCGGIIGIEREYKRRPAGFRTHILICLGAAMTTLTSQFLYLQMHYYTDMARLGAQVVAGVGFIGAGTIIVTQRQRVKGLTTAAGLWASAAMGLAIGVGFYEAALIACAVIFIVERALQNVSRQRQRVKHMELYLELRDTHALGELIATLRSRNLKAEDVDIIKPETAEKPSLIAFVTLRSGEAVSSEDVLTMLRALDAVLCAEEM